MDTSNWLTVDTEVFANYFLIMFRKVDNGQVIYFEKYNDSPLNIPNIVKLLNKYTIVTFNGMNYDIPVIEAAIAGFTNESIKRVGDMVIEQNLRPWQIRKQCGIPAVKCNHIDLIEVAPLQASLKLYAGRLHAKRMMDLPLDPATIVQDHHLSNMRYYCEIDNENTALLCSELMQEITLRTEMTEQYDTELRSKSDAQIAEAVIKRELELKHGIKAKRPIIKSGTQFYYKPPGNLHFKTEPLKEILRLYGTCPITILSSGHTELDFDYENREGRTKETYEQYWIDNPRKKKIPFAKWVESQKQKKYKLKLGDTTYTLGIGGIHSCEKSIRHVSSETCIVRDYDVEAFYPWIILNNKLYPKHLGVAFLEVFKSLVDKRLKSKAMLKKVDKKSKEFKVHTTVNESGKIIINGTFGKLGSKWSCIYSPDLMAQVTITGQLTLLMLIERLELAGVSVVSANTDGIVVKIHPDKEEEVEEIVSDWEFETDYKMEATDYESINSRDINNYIAVKKGKVESEEYSDKAYKVKGKGAYADQKDHYYRLRNNPAYDICSEAVKVFLKTGKPVEQTISECKDITKFITIRTVNGGSVKEGEPVGKVIRWYYGAHELDAIYYAGNGNKVPKSDGAVPMMHLTDEFPGDIDYAWYVNEAHEILKSIGYKR